MTGDDELSRRRALRYPESAGGFGPGPRTRARVQRALDRVRRADERLAKLTGFPPEFFYLPPHLSLTGVIICGDDGCQSLGDPPPPPPDDELAKRRAVDARRSPPPEV